jgi:hypothetical protein
MQVHVQQCRTCRNLRKTLLRDGWRMEAEDPDSLHISHPEVPDEQAARDRLSRLGLLTSARLRIAFQPSRWDTTSRAPEPPRPREEA